MPLDAIRTDRFQNMAQSYWEAVSHGNSPSAMRLPTSNPEMVAILTDYGRRLFGAIEHRAAAYQQMAEDAMNLGLRPPTYTKPAAGEGDE